ncbi:hypothetical protein MKX03_008100 [Papaver bracteatum]|nr:hypothetical protein MKX03_008100 [Papaver bracteatum]
MARILISLVLIMMSLSHEGGIGKEGSRVVVERNEKLRHNLENGQVNLSGANNLVVAGGLAEGKRAGEAGTDLNNGNAFFLSCGWYCRGGVWTCENR